MVFKSLQSLFLRHIKMDGFRIMVNIMSTIPKTNSIPLVNCNYKDNPMYIHGCTSDYPYNYRLQYLSL